MKKTNILIAMFTVITVASAARAQGSVDFDNRAAGANHLSANRIVVFNPDSGPTPVPVPPPTPLPWPPISDTRFPTSSANTLFSYNGLGEMDKIMQAQPAIKAFVASYNQHVLQDAKLGADLQLEGVVIALKLPGQVLVTKNGEVLDTIDSVIVVNTIRHNLGGSNTAITRNPGKCITWVAEVVLIWVIDHYIEKTVKKCSEWAEAQQPKPGSTPNNTNTVDQHPEQPQHWQHQY